MFFVNLPGAVDGKCSMRASCLESAVAKASAFILE